MKNLRFRLSGMNKCVKRVFVVAGSLMMFIFLFSSCAGSKAPVSATINDTTSQSDSVEMAAFPKFPWPPPAASASMKIPNSVLTVAGRVNTLSDVSTHLEAAMQKAGYSEMSYFSVPGGYALASRIEQINNDGSPKDFSERWVLKIKPSKIFSLSDYIHALFSAQKGHFRVIVFIVSNKAFVQSKDTVTDKQAMAWVRSGSSAIPHVLGEIPYTDKYRCTALIYEFEKATDASEATLMEPSNINGQQHIIKSKIWEALK